MQFGYLTPEQAYESWRTAIQGEYLVQEYECLSKDWRLRNGKVSLSTYSEIRDSVLEQNPGLRQGLYRAEKVDLVARTSEMVVFQARIRGPLWIADRWLWVRLVREGFTAVHVEDTPARATFGERDVDLLREDVLSAERRGDKTTLVAKVIVDTDTDDGTAWPRDVVLLQVGWRWKVDDFDVVDAPLVAEATIPEE